MKIRQFVTHVVVVNIDGVKCEGNILRLLYCNAKKFTGCLLLVDLRLAAD